MAERQDVVAMANGQRMATPFVLQQAPRVEDEIDSAPPIPERGRPTGAEAPPPEPAPAATATDNRVEARK